MLTDVLTHEQHFLWVKLSHILLPYPRGAWGRPKSVSGRLFFCLCVTLMDIHGILWNRSLAMSLRKRKYTKVNVGMELILFIFLNTVWALSIVRKKIFVSRCTAFSMLSLLINFVLSVLFLFFKITRYLCSLHLWNQYVFHIGHIFIVEFYHFIPSFHDLEELVQVSHTFVKYSICDISFSSPNSLHEWSSSNYHLRFDKWHDWCWENLSNSHRFIEVVHFSPIVHVPKWLIIWFHQVSQVFIFFIVVFHLAIVASVFFLISDYPSFLVFELVRQRHSPPEACEEDRLFLKIIALLCLLLLARNSIFKKFKEVITDLKQCQRN